MEQNEVWTLLNYKKVGKELGVNGSLRPNVTQLPTSNITMPDLLQKVSLKNMASTINIHFHLSPEKIHSEL